MTYIMSLHESGQICPAHFFVLDSLFIPKFVQNNFFTSVLLIDPFLYSLSSTVGPNGLVAISKVGMSKMANTSTIMVFG